MRRVIGPLGALSIVAGSMLGVGIFVSPPVVAQLLNEPWAFFAVWLLGGLFALAGASAYAELGARYRHHYVQHQNDISLFDGVLALLADLKARHHVLAVATGKSRRGLDEALQAVELRGMFDGSRTADETAGKPHPRMLQELMREAKDKAAGEATPPAEPPREKTLQELMQEAKQKPATE